MIMANEDVSASCLQGCFRGKIAVITGASDGLGYAAGMELARGHANLILAARTLSKLESASQDFLAAGAESCRIVQTDCRKVEDIENLFKQVKEWQPRVDIVLANAGVAGVRAPVWSITGQEWHEVIDANLRGVFFTCKYAVPLMKEHGGVIIITSSISGTSTFSQPGVSAYAASKAGTLALGKMLAPELARFRIRVNVVCPGHIESNIGSSVHRRDVEAASAGKQLPEGAIPLNAGKPLPKHAFGDLIGFLASDKAAFITGTQVYIDGGESLVL